MQHLTAHPQCKLHERAYCIINSADAVRRSVSETLGEAFGDVSMAAHPMSRPLLDEGSPSSVAGADAMYIHDSQTLSWRTADRGAVSAERSVPLRQLWRDDRVADALCCICKCDVEVLAVSTLRQAKQGLPY